jgi:F-type H+-transporting ATPase subunit a
MRPTVFEEHILAQIGPVPVTETMVTSAVTSVGLVLLFGVLGRAVLRSPDSRMAAAGRITLGFLRDLVSQAAGRSSPTLEIFAGTLFLFICGATVLGQLPALRSPLSNIAATSALAILVFVAVPVAGIRAQGARGYFRHYFRPNPILFPLHVVSELSRTVALALRLFGNMMSGHLVVALMLSLVGLLVPVPLMALDLLIGVLQAYIFTILACVYIGAAIRVGEGD